MPVSKRETVEQAHGMVNASNITARVRELEKRMATLEKHVSDILNEDIREPLQGEVVLDDASEITGSKSDDVP